jgi:hypothetical protein
MKQKTGKHHENSPAEYLLTGKAFCGHCGSPLVGDCGTGKSGAVHYYYSCQSRKARKGCQKKSVTKDFLERTVIDYVLDEILSDDRIEQTISVIMKKQEEAMQSSPLAAIEAEYRETLRQIDNINNAIAAGIWNSSTSAKLKSLEDAA